MGIPRVLTFDQGTEFHNQINEELMTLLKVDLLSTAYHPQTNNLDERFNQAIQLMLVKFCSDRHSTRDTYLDACTFAYNTSRQESTKYSPFELMFGRKPVLPVELDVADESPETLLSDFNTIPECSQPLMDKMIEARCPRQDIIHILSRYMVIEKEYFISQRQNSGERLSRSRREAQITGFHSATETGSVASDAQAKDPITDFLIKYCKFGWPEKHTMYSKAYPDLNQTSCLCKVSPTDGDSSGSRKYDGDGSLKATAHLRGEVLKLPDRPRSYFCK
ncbi:hypothetical protein EMCRGX_G018106 [Ephydatia muelleri]